LEGSGYGIIEVLSQYLLAGKSTEKNHEKPHPYSGHDTNPTNTQNYTGKCKVVPVLN
jgi:hypothetical protein